MPGQQDPLRNGDRAEETGDDHTDQEEKLEMKRGRLGRDETDRGSGGEEAVVQTLIGRQYGSHFGALRRQRSCGQPTVQN